MTYSTRRYETLRRLGVEQLPSLLIEERQDELRSRSEDLGSPLRGNLPIRTMPVPGRKCPSCMSRGQTIWVIPGKLCPNCGAEVN